jgi:hypothetical protein
MPMTLGDVTRFEKQNQLSVNVQTADTTSMSIYF